MQVPDEKLSSVVIGRIHISPWVGQEFEDRIVELLSAREEYEQYKHKGKGKFLWVFADILVKQVDDDKIIFARLGKNKKEKVETIFDKKNWSYTRVAVTAPKAESFSNFIIMPKSQTILFEEKKSIISINQFVEMFSSIYNQHFNDISDLKIDLVYEREKIFYKLKEYDKITEVQLNLVPSNPENETEFKKLDDTLKEIKAKAATLVFKNETDGLNIGENTIIAQGINLSSAGYGTVKFTATKGSETENFDSKSQILRYGVPKSDTPSTIISNFYKKFLGYIHGRK
jgi:hypothetical protein